MKIIYGHQPPFSVGKHGSDANVRAMVQPVAEQCGVSLVLSGHDHLYERTNPIDGVTYIVTGGGGADTYQCERSESWVAVCLSQHNFLYGEIDSEAIHIQAVDEDGQVFDKVDIPVGAAR